MKTKNLEPLPDGVFSDCFELLTEESLQEAAEKSRWLIDNFLMSGSLNMIYASAGAGKSLLSLELAHFLAKRTDISKVIYLDADNSRAALHRRGLGSIMKFHKKNNKKKKLEYYDACTEKNYSISHRLKGKDLDGIVLIIDSIRNFINFDMKDDVKVTRFLNKLQLLRNKGATIIFLHHQPKQYGEENNKMYKGATAFMDSVDEAWYLSKSFTQRGNSKTLNLDLEPQKYRLDTKPQKVAIDTKAHTIFFRDDMTIGLTQKQYITLELAKEIINANPNGIIQSELAKQIVKLANANYYEIVGKNSLWALLAEFNDKLFSIETFTPKGGGIRKLYKPLRNGAASTTKDSKPPKKSKTKTSNTLKLIQAIIADSKQGIAQKDLADLLCKQAEKRQLEIVGKNTLWKLLDEYNGVLYRAERTQRQSGYGITKMYLPLLDSDKSEYREIIVC